MRLHVDRCGHGPDLVLLHGWGMHSGAWADCLPALGARFSVHAIDLPGHGHSGTVGEFDDAVEAVAASMPASALVCGWSLGGLVAQRLAQCHPERVQALALVGSTPCFVQRDDWSAAMKACDLEAFAAALDHDAGAALGEFVRLNAVGGARSREAIRALASRVNERGTPRVRALATALRWLRETDLRAAAPQLAAPTVILHGARDTVAPVQAARWLGACLPRARLVEIADGAHVPFLTHREAFVGALESLLA